jgi:integrase
MARRIAAHRLRALRTLNDYARREPAPSFFGSIRQDRKAPSKFMSRPRRPSGVTKSAEGSRRPDIDLVRRGCSHGPEWSCGWTNVAAQRLRFLLDFGFATELSASELVGSTLEQIQTSERGEYWLRATGKGQKIAKAALPPLAWNALSRHLLARGLPVTQSHWQPETLLVCNLDEDVAGSY